MAETNYSCSATFWEEIELSESYLVSSSYEKAAALASSVIKSNLNNIDVEDTELEDMLESAGMVLIQSLSQLGRSQVIFQELKSLFVSAEAIPVQLLITGACLQISEGSAGVCEFLEEFISKWSYLDGRYYSIDGTEQGKDSHERCAGRYVLEVNRYIEMVEFYAVTLLGKNLKDLDSAISWTEKADLPEERRQEILRKLHSLYSLQSTNPLQVVSVLPEHDNESHYSSSKELNVSEDSSKVLKVKYPHMDNDMKHAILKLPNQKHSLRWFHSINLKIGNVHLVITNGKILLGCLFVFIYWIIRRRRATLKGLVTRQLSSMKKGLVDLWQLAFSYQVNPLAAVQPLPVASHGGR